MTEIHNQLAAMGINYREPSEIRTKDGVSVWRVFGDGKALVLKYFGREEDRREIENYRILSALGIPTINIIASTNCAILMEDIDQSKTYRLGIREDLEDCEVAKKIALWYKLLHTKGKAFVATYDGKLYDETDYITPENINFIAKRTQTQNNPLWDKLAANFDIISAHIAKLERTLTYNDFYYTNLIVAKDKSSAFMFDYNLLGTGYVYSDIRNVTYSLGKEAKSAFLSEYGNFNQAEIGIDFVASALTTLYLACKCEVFPNWANENLQQVRSGELLLAVKKLCCNDI